MTDEDRIDGHIRLMAQHMRRKMLANMHKGGWRDESVECLIARLREEVDELETLIRDGGFGIYGEAADVANFAMMVADVASMTDTASLVAERDAECELARLREQVDTLTRLVVRAARELPAGAAKANVLEDLLAEFPEAWRLLREHEAPATVRANGPRASARNRARMGRPVDLRSTDVCPACGEAPPRHGMGCPGVHGS